MGSLGEKLRTAMERLRTSSLDQTTIKEAVKDLQRALIASDVSVSHVLQLSKKIEELAFREPSAGINRKEFVIQQTYELLVELLGGNPKPPQKPDKILLVGIQGSGKTTTAAKLAYYYQKRGQKTGLLCADAFRPAAFEQLSQLAKAHGIAFYGEKNNSNAPEIVQNGLIELEKQGCQTIVVDSAGRSALDADLVAEIKAISGMVKAAYTWLVIGADMGQIAKVQAQSFHESVGVNGIIITRMDGSAKGGGALSACASIESPVYFIGTGEKMQDLESFEATRYLSRIMGYGDLQGLMEKIHSIELNESQAAALTEGNFDLNLFYSQLKATRQMGPLNKVMEMMGLSAKLPPELLASGEEKLKGFGYLIDSMAPAERADPEIMSSSRIDRVAKGSGRKPEEVRELLKQFKNMKKIVKQFSSMDESKMEKEGMQGLLKNMGSLQRKRKKFKLR